ncbi:hypothetical protein AVT30_gp17 [Mycobacterium phage UnionJack]|uniref:Uncharacterized protein n=1 Tax=Mycobacterium phage UnionJack TaxID=1673876 RepID=A0A0K1LIW0_9CAUD|nr:hypothetical protein AVT30_gp17 [Mycobacterium phage UnionJack]AKU42427.1 hypothetical protein UNIONJACK_75 [Mycobacterium phage UnionJack]
MTPPGYHAPADVVESFITSWGDGYLASDIATHLSCVEVEALAGLLSALGEVSIAETWIEFHSEADDCGDQHCRCEECNAG